MKSTTPTGQPGWWRFGQPRVLFGLHVVPGRWSSLRTDGFRHVPKEVSPAELNEAFRVLDLTGVFANALLGGVIARRERLDLIGFATLAVLSGLGGGLIRDILLQHGPPVALTDYAYLATAFAGAVVSFLARVDGRTWQQIWPLVDALALGTWATAGAQKTLAVGLGWLPAIILGTVTAVGGGAVRDIVLRRVPGVLGGNTLYATCAIVSSAVLVSVSELGDPNAAIIASVAVGAGLCLLARWRGWILPDADAWSPSQIVRKSYGTRLKKRLKRKTRKTVLPKAEERA